MTGKINRARVGIGDMSRSGGSYDVVALVPARFGWGGAGRGWQSVTIIAMGVLLHAVCCDRRHVLYVVRCTS